MWAVPGIHPTNSDFLQSYKMSDSSHFTRGMDVVGTISEEQEGDWEKTFLIGIRTDIWKPDKNEVAATLKCLHEKRRRELKKEIKKSGRLDAKQKSQLQKELEQDKIMKLQTDDIVQRRLVMKLFKTTGKRLNWSGTIEQITTQEVQNSIGSRRTLLSFAVILPRQDMIVYVTQNHRTFSFTSVFTFSYYCDGRMWPVCLHQRWGSMTPDYEVLVDGQRIGFVKGVLFAMGSDSYVELYEHKLCHESGFSELLTLFAASIGYHKAMCKSVKRRVSACKSGDWQKCLIEDEELKIYKNGRVA
jgi:hypothetical protein